MSNVFEYYSYFNIMNMTYLLTVLYYTVIDANFEYFVLKSKCSQNIP